MPNLMLLFSLSRLLQPPCALSPVRQDEVLGQRGSSGVAPLLSWCRGLGRSTGLAPLLLCSAVISQDTKCSLMAVHLSCCFAELTPPPELP